MLFVYSKKKQKQKTNLGLRDKTELRRAKMYSSIKTAKPRDG